MGLRDAYPGKHSLARICHTALEGNVILVLCRACGWADHVRFLSILLC